ncbi:MAG TPA: SRPBCC family protein [Nitrosopumilaceae archaeon]|jgi:uncharacterized protein YndB with AHSA1/START domain|nr:SRPBCC family protein [Nitrosopumilaceae archaeon]
MAETSLKVIFDAPAKDLWKVLSDFGGVAKYNPIVTKVVTEGTGVGSKRICTVQSPDQNSFDIDEILEDQDDNKMSNVIKIVKAPPPFAGMVVKSQISELEQNKSQVEWFLNFHPGEMPETDAKNILQGIFGQIGDSLKEYLKNGGVS